MLRPALSGLDGRVAGSGCCGRPTPHRVNRQMWAVPTRRGTGCGLLLPALAGLDVSERGTGGGLLRPPLTAIDGRGRGIGHGMLRPTSRPSPASAGVGETGCGLLRPSLRLAALDGHKLRQATAAGPHCNGRTWVGPKPALGVLAGRDRIFKYDCDQRSYHSFLCSP